MENHASDTVPIVGEADVTEADLAHVATQLPGSQRPWLVPALVAAGFLVFLVLNPAAPREQILSLALPAAFAVLLTVLFQRAARRAWIKQALTNVGGPTTFRFDDYGFASESSMRQHRLAWAVLVRVPETAQAFLVYTTPGTVLIVPKRAFADAEVARLRRWLPERITPTPLQKAGLFGARSTQRTLLLWVLLVVAFLAIWQFLDQPPPQHRRHAERENAAAAARPSRGGEASDVDSSP